VCDVTEFINHRTQTLLLSVKAQPSVEISVKAHPAWFSIRIFVNRINT